MLQELESKLCSAFCGGLQVHPVPAGYAVSSAFEDSSGDRISFYITETPDGYQIEDDGSYLADLVARDINIETGARGELLKAILTEGQAYWDPDTYEIKSSGVVNGDLPGRAIQFLSSLIRVCDLALITRERVRSAFREDFIRALTTRFGDDLDIRENVAPANDLADFPADVVLTTPDRRVGAIYLVNTNDKLNEAHLAWLESRERHSEVVTIAVLEDMESISKKRFQRALNRRLPTTIFRGDEEGAMDFVTSVITA